MKTLLAISISLFLYGNIFGQGTDSVSFFQDTAVYKNADVLPKFPGGDQALADFIVHKFKYPQRALNANLVSDVISASFVITTEGKVKDIIIIQGSQKAPSLDDETVRVLSLMPNWKPAQRNGNLVNFIYFLHVSPWRHEDKLEIRVSNITLMNHRKAIQDREYNLGVSLSNKGNYAGAIEHFTKALDVNPTDIDALYNRGVMRIKLNDIEGACSDFNRIKNLGQADADQLLKKYCTK